MAVRQGITAIDTHAGTEPIISVLVGRPPTTAMSAARLIAQRADEVAGRRSPAGRQELATDSGGPPRVQVFLGPVVPTDRGPRTEGGTCA